MKKTTRALAALAITAPLLVSTAATEGAHAASGWSVSKGAGGSYPTEVILWSNGQANTTVNGSGRLALYARADQCSGSPQVTMTVDGKHRQVFNITNSRGSWAYPMGVSVPSGRHKVTISFTNNYAKRGCDRNVHVHSVKNYVDTSNPFNQAKMYGEPWWKKTANDAAATYPADSYENKALSAISSKPTATWLGPWYPRGKVGPKVASTIKEANAKGQIPTLVIYGMYGCIGKSSGAIREKDYWAWLGEIAYNIGPNRVAVVLEPDALGLAGGCPKNMTYLKGAVNALETHRAAFVYIDAGHSGWMSPNTALTRLRSVGVNKTRGFSLNVANTQSDASNRKYGDTLAKALGKHYVVDSSRNGKRVKGECNPVGAALGSPPRSYRYGYQDASLWIKPPGDSDGTCNGGPVAGKFWAPYAVNLVRGAGWRL